MVVSGGVAAAPQPSSHGLHVMHRRMSTSPHRCRCFRLVSMPAHVVSASQGWALFLQRSAHICLHCCVRMQQTYPGGHAAQSSSDNKDKAMRPLHDAMQQPALKPAALCCIWEDARTSQPALKFCSLHTDQVPSQDAKMFRRKKWKYLILDEAHMIKNWKSQRWQTLLNFNSKRRLLITGEACSSSRQAQHMMMRVCCTIPACSSSRQAGATTAADDAAASGHTSEASLSCSGNPVMQLQGVLWPDTKAANSLRLLASPAGRLSPNSTHVAYTCSCWQEPSCCPS